MVEWDHRGDSAAAKRPGRKGISYHSLFGFARPQFLDNFGVHPIIPAVGISLIGRIAAAEKQIGPVGAQAGESDVFYLEA